MKSAIADFIIRRKSCAKEKHLYNFIRKMSQEAKSAIAALPKNTNKIIVFSQISDFAKSAILLKFRSISAFASDKLPKRVDMTKISQCSLLQK